MMWTFFNATCYHKFCGIRNAHKTLTPFQFGKTARIAESLPCSESKFYCLLSTCRFVLFVLAKLVWKIAPVNIIFATDCTSKYKYQAIATLNEKIFWNSPEYTVLLVTFTALNLATSLSQYCFNTWRTANPKLARPCKIGFEKPASTATVSIFTSRKSVFIVLHVIVMATYTDPTKNLASACGEDSTSDVHIPDILICCSK